jgi:hypothetical protein
MLKLHNTLDTIEQGTAMEAIVRFHANEEGIADESAA